MTEQLDPLQFVESQINLLKRFNRTLDDMLFSLAQVASYLALDATGKPPEFECCLEIGGVAATGLGASPKKAVLDCLEKMKESLSNG